MTLSCWSFNEVQIRSGILFTNLDEVQPVPYGVVVPLLSWTVYQRSSLTIKKVSFFEYHSEFFSQGISRYIVATFHATFKEFHATTNPTCRISRPQQQILHVETHGWVWVMHFWGPVSRIFGRHMDQDVYQEYVF